VKVRLGFISNSSSTAFIITNRSKKPLTIVDFVKENPHLIEDFKEQYDWYKDDPEYTQENLIKSAEERLKSNHDEMTFKPDKHEYVVFGDEQYDLIGKVFDYILRDGGWSENFHWRFCEYLR
jgi:hypothetical protein